MKDLLTRWPVVQQLLMRSDGMHADAKSERTRNLAPKHHGAQVARSVCPYCAVGCGQLVYHKDGKLISIEGDPESPISRGRLCPKGSDSFELLTHANRETRVKYRRPYSTRWEELDLETAMDMIADRVWESRERTFVEERDDPPGDARGEVWFMYHLGRRLRDKARLDPRPRNAGLNALTWDYTLEGEFREPSVAEILQEINGRNVADGTLVKNFTELKADGSTDSGCWIYSGIFPAPDRNIANSRHSLDFYGHGWTFAWPADRRILYNRASARPDGKPWSERKKLVWWDETQKKWTGLDVPDFTATKPPDYKPPRGAEGDAALAGDRPFILHPDGVGWIWAPVGMADGPLPAHYEPWESPVHNPVYPKQQHNPPAMSKERPDNQYADSPDQRFPYVFTTYRLTEHHTSGAMSRMLPHLAELQPEFFCEISPELAAEKGIENGGWMTIIGMRGIVEARALVTPRIQPLVINGKRVHQIGLPYHWGYRGLVKGDAANDLLSISEEPNVRIMESKGLLCDVRAGRRGQGKQALEQLAAQIERRPWQ